MADGEDIASVCDGAALAVVNDVALLRLAQPSTLRSLPRHDEATRARLLSACTSLLCNAVTLEGDEGDGEGDGGRVVTEVPIIVALLQVLHHANVVYVSLAYAPPT